MLIVGLGPRAKFDAGRGVLRRVRPGQAALRQASRTVAVVLPEAVDPDRRVTSALVEGIVAGTRGPGPAQGRAGPAPVRNPRVVVDPERAGRIRQPSSSRRCDGARSSGEAVNLARDLANTPPSEKPPARLAERIRSVAADAGIGVEVWDEARIRAGAVRRPARRGRRLGRAPGVRRPRLPPRRRRADPRPGRQGGHVRLRRPLAQADAPRWRT